MPTESRLPLEVKSSPQIQVNTDADNDEVLESNMYKPSRKRKISNINTTEDPQDSPFIKRVKRSTGQKRKADEQNGLQQKQRKINNWQDF